MIQVALSRGRSVSRLRGSTVLIPFIDRALREKRNSGGYKSHSCDEPSWAFERDDEHHRPGRFGDLHEV